MSSSSVVATVVARGSVSVAEEVIPCLDKFYSICSDEPLDLT